MKGVSNKGGRLLVLALIAIALLVATWFLGSYDLEKEHVWRGPKASVWRERFLAAERTLAKLDVTSQRIGALETLEGFGPETVAVVPDGRGRLSARARGAALDFVARGGHLIVEAEDPNTDDALLDALEIKRHEIDSKLRYFGFWSDWTKPLTEPNPPGATSMVEVKLADDAPPLLVRLGGRAALDAENPRFTVGAADELRLVQVDRGKGRVTAVSDLGFATNAQLGRDDNAEFFTGLVKQTPTGSASAGAPPSSIATRVAFYRGEREALGAWLVAHAPLVLISLALLVGVWLWREMPRLGPLLPDPEPRRRRLLDHLRASGRLLWAAGRKGTLARAAATGAMAEVARHYPHVRLMSEAERAAFVVTRFSIAPSVAPDLVAGTLTSRSGPALIQLVRACAQIHAQLAPGAAVSHLPLSSSSSTTSPS